MGLRMKWFKCPSCGAEYEDLVYYEEDFSEKCEVCGEKDIPVSNDFLKQVHREGNKYRHVSWSLWQAGN